MQAKTVVNGQYTFYVGETFNNYNELLERMELHTRESFVYYWRRDTRTVKGAFMKTSRPIAQHLKYYSVRYACVYGGQKFRSRGLGQRQTQTMRSNCPSFIMLRASKCGQKLEVISVCNVHNHEISEIVSQCMPQNRRLPDDVKDEVLELMRLHVDRKRIIEYVKVRTNKQLTHKDLLNLKATCKNQKPSNYRLNKEFLQEILNNGLLKRVEESDGITSEEKIMSNPETNDTVEELVNELSDIEANHDTDLKEYSLVEENNDDQIVELLVEEENDNIIDEEEIPYDIVQEDLYTNEIKRNETPQSYEYFITEDNDNIKIDTPQEHIDCSNSDANQFNAIDIIEENANDSTDNSLCQRETDTSIEKNAKLYKYFSKTKNSLNRSIERQNRRKKLLKKYCKHCGSNAGLVNMQIAVLRAQKLKLIEETHVLKLKKEKLMAELRQING